MEDFLRNALHILILQKNKIFFKKLNRTFFFTLIMCLLCEFYGKIVWREEEIWFFVDMKFHHKWLCACVCMCVYVSPTILSKHLSNWVFKLTTCFVALLWRSMITFAIPDNPSNIASSARFFSFFLSLAYKTIYIYIYIHVYASLYNMYVYECICKYYLGIFND